MSEILIRNIIETDNKPLKILVEATLKEFGAQNTSCSSNDDEVNNMYQTYHQPNNFYLVVEKNNKILGGAGCVALKKQDIKACELRKMYFSPQLRGLGIGKKLLDMCIETAKKLGYDTIQLETMPTMITAQNLYTSRGFVKQRKDQQSHCNQACDIFMVKQL